MDLQRSKLAYQLGNVFCDGYDLGWNCNSPGHMPTAKATMSANMLDLVPLTLLLVKRLVLAKHALAYMQEGLRERMKERPPTQLKYPVSNRSKVDLFCVVDRLWEFWWGLPGWLLECWCDLLT